MARDEFDNDTGEIFSDEVGDYPQEPPFIRSAYNYAVDAVSFETGLYCADESLAQQHMAEDADINTIVRRFGLTGHMPVGVKLPSYGDFTGIVDYRSALEAVQEAEDSFYELPADLRARFDNDPQLYLDFASNPANQEEIYDLGLADRPRPAASSPVDVPQAAPVPSGASSAEST